MALTWKTVHYGIHSAYVTVGGVPSSDNPPVLLYPFWFLGWLYQKLISPSFPPIWVSDPKLLRFMLRLPSLGADLLIGALIFRVLQRKSLSFNASLGAASAYLLNPAVIFDSAYWGQTAAIHTLFMLLALIATDRRAYVWAGAALTAAVLTKPHALAIVPLVFVLAVREHGWWRISVAGSLTVLLIVAPFLLAGNIDGVCAQYVKTTQYSPFLSANAHNLWWLVSGGHGWQNDAPLGATISFRSAGLLLFGSATLLSSVAVWRQRQTLFLAAAYQSLAFFMLNTQIHENHLLPMFAPLVIVAALDRSAWWLYGGFAFTALANMALHDPALIGWLGYPNDEIFGGPALAIPRWLNAAAQVSLFIAFTLRMIKPLLRDLHPQAAQIAAD
jgi:Gpi18-like mannosyltransferase